MKKNNYFSINKLLLTAAMLSLFACDGTVDESTLINQAKTYIQDNKPRDATIELKNILQTNPKNAEARYLLGEINIEYGDMASAEKDFQRALEEGWKPEEAAIGKMRAMLASKKYKEVLAESYDTKDWTAAAQANMQAIQAAAHSGSGDLEQGKSTLLIAKKLDANAYDVMKATIQLQLVEKQTEDAEKTLSKALQLYPDDSALLLLSASHAILGKENERAIKIYQQIIASGSNELMTPDKRRAHLGILKLSAFNKNTDLLNKSRKALIDRKATDPEVDYNLALVAFKEKKYDEAEGYLKNILKISTTHAPTLLLSGTVSYAKGDYGQAIYFLSKYLSISPKNIQARKLLGRTYMALGQHDDAQREFKAGLKENANDAELIALIGLSEINSGQVQAGIDELTKALALAPDNQSLKQQLAKAYIAEGQTKKAINLLDEILQNGDDNYQIKHMKVLAYLRDKNIEMSMKTAQKLLDESPKNPETLNLMGNIQQVAGDKAAARKYYKQALKADPDHIGSELNLAQLDEADGDVASAEKHYLSILNKKPENTRAMISLSKIAAQQGDSKKQIKWLEAARQADKQELVSRVTLVEVFLEKKRISDVEILVRELQEYHADNPAVLLAESRLLMAQKRFSQAESTLSHFINTQPEQDIGYYLQAQNQLLLGKRSEALNNSRKAYSLKPDALRNIILLARVELSAGNYDQALKLGEVVIETVPDASAGYVIKANALLATKKYLEAQLAANKAWSKTQSQRIAILRFKLTRSISGIDAAIPIYVAWLESHPDDETITLKLATAYLTGKHHKESVTYFEKVLALNPDNIIALNNLAWLYGLENNSRALVLAQKAYQLKPESPGIKDTYGWILLNSGKTTEALTMLQQAADKLPNIPDVQYHYAKALYISGDKAAATRILKPLVASGKTFDGRSDAEMMLAQ